MQIPNKNLKVWKSVIADLGWTATAAGSKINFRTLKRAVDEGACLDRVFVSVEAFVAKRQAKVKKILAKVNDDNN
jgi:hypothetical protein